MLPGLIKEAVWTQRQALPVQRRFTEWGGHQGCVWVGRKTPEISCARARQRSCFSCDGLGALGVVINCLTGAAKEMNQRKKQDPAKEMNRVLLNSTTILIQILTSHQRMRDVKLDDWNYLLILFKTLVGQDYWPALFYTTNQHN